MEARLAIQMRQNLTSSISITYFYSKYLKIWHFSENKVKRDCAFCLSCYLLWNTLMWHLCFPFSVEVRNWCTVNKQWALFHLRIYLEWKYSFHPPHGCNYNETSKRSHQRAIWENCTQHSPCVSSCLFWRDPESRSDSYSQGK